jgi:ferrochelatase
VSELGRDSPALQYPPPWHTDPLFIQAVAARVRSVLETLTVAQRAQARLIFTAHSIPLAMDRESGYSAQIEQSCRLTADELGLERWGVAYQSRSGNPHDPWLEPDIAQVLRETRGQVAVVMPIGFICDHVEVLYDLDVEAASIARANALVMRRAPTVGDHPLFIRMIAELLKRDSIEDRGG